MDIDQLHRELAKAILAADAEATRDTAAFVRQFLAGLNVGADSSAQSKANEFAPTLTEEQTRELEAWAERGVVGVKAGIAHAIKIGGQAGTMTSELAAQLAEEAFTRTWQDGKQLSTRLWDWKAGNKQGITQALQQGIRQMQGVSKTMYDMQRAIEGFPPSPTPPPQGGRGYNLFEIVNRHQDDWVSELYDSAQTLIHDPKAKVQWNKTLADIRGHVAQLAETGTKHAAERVLDQITKAVAKGNADLVQSAARWWIYDKQLYNLKRIVRTEMANAGHTAIIESTQDSEDVIGYQWRLSASHPHADICDYYAGIEMGLGKGVWPKGQEPKHKAHPHCMCLIVPRITPVKTKGSVNYAEFIKNATPERQAQLLPKWAKQLTALGTPLDALIRPDGLGLVTQKDLAARMGEDKLKAAETLGKAMTERDWGTRTFQSGKMTRRTIQQFEPFAHEPEVKSLLDDIKNQRPVGGLRLKYIQRKYPEQEAIASPDNLNTWFDAVLRNPESTLHQRPRDDSRYVVHNATLKLTAVIDPSGQRVTAYADETGEKLEAVWLTLNDLTDLSR